MDSSLAMIFLALTVAAANLSEDSPCHLQIYSLLPLEDVRVAFSDENIDDVGKCVKLSSCTVLVDLLIRRPEGFADYLKNSVCARDRFNTLYCCPPSEDFLPYHLMPDDETEENNLSSDRSERSVETTEPEFGAVTTLQMNASSSEASEVELESLPTPAMLVNEGRPVEHAVIKNSSLLKSDNSYVVFEESDSNEQSSGRRGHRGRGKVFFDFDKPARPTSGRVFFRDDDQVVNPLPVDSTVVFENEIPHGLPPLNLGLTTKPTTTSPSSTTTSLLSTTTPPRGGRLEVDPLEAKKVLLPDPKADLFWDRCGLPGVARIVGGTDAGVGKYPWMVRLGYKEDGTNEVDFRCAGAMINERYVLTAAHCVQRDGAKPSVARFGEYDETSDPECPPNFPFCAKPVKDIEIARIVSHISYNKPLKQNENDIALLRLKDTVDTSDTIRPICLPFDLDSRIPRQVNPTNKTVEVYAAGWGSLGSGLGYSKTLKEVALPVFDQEKCEKIFRRLKINITDSQMCAGGISGKDSCDGDSGGPLMMKNDDDLYTLVGVVSYGPKMCGTQGVPAVYTRVTRYLRWILETIEP